MKIEKSVLISLCWMVVLLAHGAYADETEELSELPQIVISANPLAPSLLEYSGAASVMEQEDIKERAQTTLGETLALEPGVHGSFFGQGASRPVVRGFAGERVRVLRNGVGTGDVSDISEDHAVVADPLQAERIEILRGPETLLYGSSAIGGAINVVDGSIPEVSLGEPVAGEFLSQFGNSADNEKTLGGLLKGELGSFNWQVSAFSRETDDYEIPGLSESGLLLEQEEHSGDFETEDTEMDDSGIVANSDTDTWGATAGGSYVWDRGFIGLSVGAFDSNYGVPGHVHAGDHSDHEEHEDEFEHEHEDEHGHEFEHSEHDEESEDVRIDMQQVRFDARGRFDDLSDELESIRYRLGYTDYEHDEIEGSTPSTNYQRETFESRVELVHAPWGNLKGAGGLALLYDDFAALGEEAFLTPTRTVAPALFMFEELPLSSELNLQFGGRLEYVTLDPLESAQRDFVPFSLSVGPVWNPDNQGDYTLALTLAYSERAPNAVELFADGQHLARQIFELGDASLDKESSWGVDFVMRKNSGIFKTAVTPFFQGFTNFINLGGTGTEEEGLPVFRYEEIAAYFWGLEVENSLALSDLVDIGQHAVSFEHQLDFVRARNTDESENIPRVPPLRNILRLRYGYADALEALVEGVIVEKQDRLAPFELQTAGYSLLNAQLSLAIPTGHEAADDLSLFVRGSNLTNEEARVHNSFLKDLAPLRGRSILFGLRYSL